MKFIVELEEGVFLDIGEGDPCRTLVRASAHQFSTIPDAVTALDDARKYQPFRYASVLPVE